MAVEEWRNKGGMLSTLGYPEGLCKPDSLTGGVRAQIVIRIQRDDLMFPDTPHYHLNFKGQPVG